MRVSLPNWGLSVGFAALLVPRVALAEEPGASADKAAPNSDPAGAEAAEPAAVTDENEQPGYIPGYRKSSEISLSPTAPRAPSRVGGVTVPAGARHAGEGGYQFKFTGYASASLRLSGGARDNATVDQQQMTLHEAPRTPDFYGAFGGTNATPGSWVDLHFQFGNDVVTSHVTLTTWKPTGSSNWNDVRSQQLVDQAYLQFNFPAIGKLQPSWTVGAFRNIYGGLGQYSAGQYNTPIIGMPFGVGETLNLRYDVDENYSIILEHGFMGRLGKPAANSGPTPFDSSQSPGEPSSWVHHAHLGVAKNGDIPLVASLHYLTNWSQDERDQKDDPQTFWIDERQRPDGRLSVYGADFRMINNYLGNFAIAGALVDAQDAQLLTGLGVFGAVNGEELTKRYLGQRGRGTAKMAVAGFEYNISWAKFLYHPEPFWGEGPDLITSVFSNVGSVMQSDDPDFDGRKMAKAGAEVTYRFLPWVGISGRYDHVMPNSKDEEESFDVISPKLLFKTDWNSHEQITVSYTKWFYGENTHAEFPLEMPRAELDDQMFALHFGMWW